MKLHMKPVTYMMILCILALLIAGLEFVFREDNNASIILTFIFWSAIVQGCIAIVAISDTVHGKWINPLKSQLLSVYPMLLLLAFLLLSLIFQLKVYPWTNHETKWLQKPFFMYRNFILTILTFVSAAVFARKSLKEDTNKSTYAILYLVLFVVSQSLTAFDIVMSLEFPWVSTLFGGYFFVESIYAGIAIAGIICFFHKKILHTDAGKPPETQKDVATLLFGFSLFWAGLFYSQYLVIWYGNIPDELSYLYTRITVQPYRTLSVAALLFLFPVPFITLIFKKTKLNSAVLLAVSTTVLTGILFERLVFLIPVAPVNTILAIFEFLSLSYIFFLSITNRTLIFPNYFKN